MAITKVSSVDLLTGELVEPFRKPLSRISVVVEFKQPSMTHQSHAESCDINNIIRQYDRTGVLPPPTRQPQYGDVSELNEELTNLMVKGREASAAVNSFFAERKKLAALKEAEPANPPAPAPAS